MTLTKEQKGQLSQLLSYRDSIVDDLFKIEQILKDFFPEEFDVAYQHWIPQIITALHDDSRWLPRGQYNMQHCIDSIVDKTTEATIKGVSKYIGD